MKLTDFAIVANIFFICILVVCHVKGDVLHHKTMNQIMYNNVMDNVTEDSLAAAYVGVGINGKPEVKLDRLSLFFESEAKLYGENSKHILCYVEGDGYYLCTSYEGYKWSEKNLFSENGEISHEEKVSEIVECINSDYSIKLSLPYNEGEKWSNSIWEYTFFSISYDRLMGIYCFSGARIHKK